MITKHKKKWFVRDIGMLVSTVYEKSLRSFGCYTQWHTVIKKKIRGCFYLNVVTTHFYRCLHTFLGALKQHSHSIRLQVFPTDKRLIFKCFDIKQQIILERQSFAMLPATNSIQITHAIVDTKLLCQDNKNGF